MKRLSLLAVLIGTLLTVAGPALAHPLGNFTTNLHLGIHIDKDRLDVRLIVDMAEIPTFREPLDADDDGTVSADDLDSYAVTSCQEHRKALVVEADATPILITGSTSTASLLPGEGDLHTLRVECFYTATLPTGTVSLDVSNLVYEERIGWVEMVVTGGSAEGIPSSSPSKLLTEYPDTSPLAQRQATITLGEAGEVAAAAPPESNGVTARLATGLASNGSAGGVIALAAAVGLGVTHALAPGHGKTLMAAYLVGRRGRPRQALGLGMAVAVSHTLGVGVLGLVTALASSTFQPDRVYPWLTTGSALIVTGLGVALLVKAIRGRAHHHHDHHDHSHDDEHDHHDLPDLGWRSLAALGLAGGLVPSASAVVLLLGAVAIGRPWFGVLLVFGFGVGMSVALVTAGLLALRLSKVGLDRIERRIALPRRLVPALAGLAVTSVGGFLLWDALRTLTHS